MDTSKARLTSGQFARLCDTTKETLRHYKDLGLLLPRIQGENGYFYYVPEQFYDFYAISIFRQTGTPLEEIRRCLRGREPAKTLESLKKQRQRLQKVRRELEEMDFVLSRTIENLELGEQPEWQVKKRYFEAEHLLALPVEELERRLDLEAGEDERLMEVLEQCRNLCRQYGLQTDHQLGAIHQGGQRPGEITHLYTRIKEGGRSPYYRRKPAGIYLYLCCRGRWDISEGHEALAQYIQQRGLETEGPFYACDLAGFILNGVEKNAMSMLSVLLRDGG